MKKTSQLRALLTSPNLEFIMEAHSGLSAKIAEEAGFKGIWGSGLSISASTGVRDNNELSWTQVLEIVEYMSDATSIPILLDGDTGYGNFNNMRRLVKKLEERGVAGVCIEDKLFPKTNSFLRQERQPLADPQEFSGKIKAGKDSQNDPDFCVVARVEAFIAGWGLNETLERANAYYEAGADAVLIHSKISKPDEILAFMKNWHNKCPVVIVPTKYYATPTQVFRDNGVSMVVWANHLLRSGITAMQQTAAKIHATETLIEVEDAVAPLSEVFRLQNDKELQQAEKIYLRSDEAVTMNAVILAASRGASLGDMTESIPKALIPVGGKPLIHRTVSMLREQGVADIAIVRGYRKEAFDLTGVIYADNDAYAETGELVSLNLAAKTIGDNCIISYGDILFRKHILRALLEESGEIVIAVDARPQPSVGASAIDAVMCSGRYTRGMDDAEIFLERLDYAAAADIASYHGEWIGLMKVSGAGAATLASAMKELAAGGNFSVLGVGDLLNYFVRNNVPVRVLYIEGNWVDVDTLADYSRTSSY